MEEQPDRSTIDGPTVLAEGRKVLLAAAECLAGLADRLGGPFVRAVEMVLRCPGKVVVTGIGKAGHVGTKISATLASTGTPSIFLHPTDALHGDLGRVQAEDVALVLSNSGSSREVIELLPPLRSIGASVLAITGDERSPLAREADCTLCYGRHEEAGRLGLAPTTTTTAMQALGDALAMAVLSQRPFTPAQFARYHPAGALGRSLLRVADVMRKGERNPVAPSDAPVHEVLRVMTETPGRPGAASLVGEDGRIEGFYTDGDFRRLVEQAAQGGRFEFLARPIREFMTKDPLTIQPDRLVAEAMRLLRERKVDQLPVVDDSGRPVGLLDVQDVLEARVLP